MNHLGELQGHTARGAEVGFWWKASTHHRKGRLKGSSPFLPVLICLVGLLFGGLLLLRVVRWARGGLGGGEIRLWCFDLILDS